MADTGTEQRSLFRRWPAGVSIVVAEVGGHRHGPTVSSLVSLSLDPPLVGISVAQSASIHELLREAGTWAVSILAGDQEDLAQQFARSGVPPLILWDGIDVRDDDPRLIAGAVGWLTARTVQTLVTGDHTFFVGQVELGGRSGLPRRRSSTRTAPITRCDRGRRRLRPRRRPGRLGAGVGRGARGARARARRPLHAERAARHDGHELARVVALHARRRSALPSRPRRSTPRSCGACSTRYRRALPLHPGRSRPCERLAARVAARRRVVVEPRADRRALARRGSRRSSRATVSSEEVARGKPAPDVYLEAARRLGVDPSRARARSRTRTTASARRRRRACASSPSRTRTSRPTTRRSRSPTSCSRRLGRADSSSTSRSDGTIYARRRARGGRSRCGRRGPSRSRARRRSRRSRASFGT